MTGHGIIELAQMVEGVSQVLIVDRSQKLLSIRLQLEHRHRAQVIAVGVVSVTV